MDKQKDIIEEELNKMFSSLFEKLNIKVNDELEYNIALENDFYEILIKVEEHINNIKGVVEK